jgi:hypothetical protein
MNRIQIKHSKSPDNKKEKKVSTLKRMRTIRATIMGEDIKQNKFINAKGGITNKHITLDDILSKDKLRKFRDIKKRTQTNDDISKA